MNILVIGGAGYIGAHVTWALIQKGYTVRVFDNMSTGRPENLFEQAEFVKGDILDTSALETAMQGMDAVVHLAAKKSVGDSMSDPATYSVNNITGTLNVLNAMIKTGVRHFVFSSSAAVYGMPDVAEINETCPVNPINYYGFTKLEIERFLDWYDKLKGITFVSLRYFNAVGYDADGAVKGLEQNPQNLLPIIMEVVTGTRPELSIFGNDYPTPDGTCIRDFIHVTDLATAHVLAIEHLIAGKESQKLNLATGSGHSVLDMLRQTEQIIGRPIPHRFTPRRQGDPSILIANADRATTVLGWRAEHSSLENIIRTTLAVYQK